MVLDKDFFHSIMSNSYSQYGYSTEEFQTLQLVILVVFSTVDFCPLYFAPFFLEISFKQQLVWLTNDFTLK